VLAGGGQIATGTPLRQRLMVLAHPFGFGSQSTCAW
jgi:hypothetical protein